MNDTLESLIEKLAPTREGVNGIEHYSVQGLLRRLGVEAEDLHELLESGAICSCGKAHKNVTGDGEVFPFRSDDLNQLRRALVIEGLKAIAAEQLPEDSPEGERRFCRAAEFTFAMARRALKGSHNVMIRLSQDALSRSSARHVIEFEEPALTGKVARDRYVKKLRDEDQARRDSNVLRAGATGALAGALLPFRRLRASRRALIGAGAGAAGVLAVRKATEGTQDAYGERSRGAKRAEAIPAVAGLGLGGYAALRKVRRVARFENTVPRREFALPGAALLGLLQRIGAKFAGVSKRKLIGASGLLGGTLGGMRAATDNDPETGVMGGALRGGLKGAAIGTAGVIGAPRAYGAARGIAAQRAAEKVAKARNKYAVARVVSP